MVWRSWIEVEVEQIANDKTRSITGMKMSVCTIAVPEVDHHFASVDRNTITETNRSESSESFISLYHAFPVRYVRSLLKELLWLNQ